MIDIPSGRVAYAVLSFGGVLGMGNKLFAVPWSSLKVDEDEKCFILDVNKKMLEGAPGFDKSHWPDMGSEVYRYYGAAPRQGKSPSTQAGEYVREEIEHVREGKHGARAAKQAVAIGLSKASRAGVKLPLPPGKKAPKATGRKPNPKRSRATGSLGARKHGRLASSALAPGQQQRTAAGSANRRTAAQKAVRTKGAAGRHNAAVKAARTRARRVACPPGLIQG